MKISKHKLLARYIANSAIRNTFLEDLHSGKSLPEKYKEGYSRIDDREMRKFMLEVEDKLEQILDSILSKSKKIRVGTYIVTKKKFYDAIKKLMFGEYGVSWDIPQDTWEKLQKDYQQYKQHLTK